MDRDCMVDRNGKTEKQLDRETDIETEKKIVETCIEIENRDIENRDG